MLNTNYIMLNEKNIQDRYLNLEEIVYNETHSRKNVAAVVVFDSCREQISL